MLPVSTTQQHAPTPPQPSPFRRWPCAWKQRSSTWRLRSGLGAKNWTLTLPPRSKSVTKEFTSVDIHKHTQTCIHTNIITCKLATPPGGMTMTVRQVGQGKDGLVPATFSTHLWQNVWKHGSSLGQRYRSRHTLHVNTSAAIFFPFFSPDVAFLLAILQMMCTTRRPASVKHLVIFFLK